MQYKKNFLSDVILRVDFDSEEDALKTELCEEVRNACVKYFPVPEGSPVESQRVEFTREPGSGNVISKIVRFNEWHFFGRDREKELCLTHSSLFVVYKRYDSFDALHKEFFYVLNEVLTNYPQIRINRIGLRYIDKIKPTVAKTTRQNWHSYWTKYISKRLINGLKFARVDSRMTRHLNSIEMNYGDYQLRFVYGISNEDYPAPNKKSIFILDTDVFTRGLLSYEEAKDNVITFHNQAREWFESAIEEPLREIMNE